MGKYVCGDAADMDRLVEETCRAIGAEIAALSIPPLAGVVLGGGYGRGEGGVDETCGRRRLANDLDFYTVTHEGAGAADIAAIAAALAPVSEKWSREIGIDVDFCVPKTPWRIKHDEKRLMIQELVRGYIDVCGAPGHVLFADIERLPAEELPFGEAERLLLNRGAGLLLAKEPGRDAKFVVRNINKAVLGAGDARLIARGGYMWRMAERAAALGESLYARAAEWKARPREEAVCTWEEARACWLAACAEVAASPRAQTGGRTLRNALRWFVRRRTVGPFASFGLEPEKRVLAGIKRAVEERRGFAPALKKDWTVFN